MINTTAINHGRFRRTRFFQKTVFICVSRNAGLVVRIDVLLP